MTENTQLACEYCNKQYKTLSYLNKHIAQKHTHILTNLQTKINLLEIENNRLKHHIHILQQIYTGTTKKLVQSIHMDNIIK